MDPRTKIEPIANCSQAANSRPALDKCLDAFADRVMVRVTRAPAVDEPTPPEVSAFLGMGVAFGIVAFFLFSRLGYTEIKSLLSSEFKP